MYRPHHSWRHGYRREKFRRWFLWFVKMLLVAEGMILGRRYIAAHTFTNVYEREITGEAFGADPAGEPDGNVVYGIGINAGSGEMFWFHKRSEREQPSEVGR